MNRITPNKKGLWSPFYSPLQEVHVLLRLGIDTFQDPFDSFLCACLTSYEDKFRDMSKQEQITVINNVKNSIKKLINDKLWVSCKIIMYKIKLKDVILENLGDISKDDKTIELLFKVVKIEDMKQIIYDHNYANDKTVIVTAKELQENFVSLAKTQFDKYKELAADKKLKWLDKLSTTTWNLIQKALDKSKESFDSMNSTQLLVNSENITYTQTELNRDIYMLEANDYHRLPPTHVKPDVKNTRKSIVVIKITNSSYEAVGKIVEEDVTTEFYNVDPLIKKLYTYIYTPEYVCQIYPELVKYLPDKLKTGAKKFNRKCSKSPKRRKIFPE